MVAKEREMDYEFICRTEGCKSNGLISIITDPAMVVICGWCHQEFTDRTPITPEAVIDTEPIV
jgi:hypothetical protein